jgi:hypothetical protein
MALTMKVRVLLGLLLSGLLCSCASNTPLLPDKRADSPNSPAAGTVNAPSRSQPALAEAR